jgi:hypothetical protein
LGDNFFGACRSRRECVRVRTSAHRAVHLRRGLLYLMIARPDRHSDDGGEVDAIEVAAKLRSLRAGSSTA